MMMPSYTTATSLFALLGVAAAVLSTLPPTLALGFSLRHDAPCFSSACGGRSRRLLRNQYRPLAFSTPFVGAPISTKPRPSGSSTLSMKIRVAIIGLPNVGKSALFNALARQSDLAKSSNFPFCTIDPNVAPVSVPSSHLAPLSKLAGSRRTVPAVLEFVDVAGLVRGASRGEGLGNRFLATVREADAVVHVVRVHDDANVVHVDGRVNPVEDAEAVNVELVLADLAHVERRLEKKTCAGVEREGLQLVKEGLEGGKPARVAGLSQSQTFAMKSMGLLTLKPVLYAFNVDEIDFLFDRDEALAMARDCLDRIQYRDPERDGVALVSAKLEATISSLDDAAERAEYLASLGVEESDHCAEIDTLLSHDVLPRAILDLLHLGLVYTGPGVPPEKSRTTKAHLFSRSIHRDDEPSASTSTTNSRPFTARDLAGRIHGDIVKGFIRAEVVSAERLLEYGGLGAAKDAGEVRSEGTEYAVEAGDVVLIKWK